MRCHTRKPSKKTSRAEFLVCLDSIQNAYSNIQEMLENFGATDIQLIPQFALRLSSKCHANGSVVEAGVALLANTLLPVWSLNKKGKTIPQR